MSQFAAMLAFAGTFSLANYTTIIIGRKFGGGASIMKVISEKMI